MSQCKTGKDANDNVNCRVIATGNSVDQVWSQLLKGYSRPKLHLFTESTNTACGAATSDVGPFYCPADRTVYIDTSFYQVLQDRFGSSGGPLAQEYVIAHEYGHHVQNLLGDISKAQKGVQGATGGSVRTELQADCYAGCLGPPRLHHQRAGFGHAVPEAVERQGHRRCPVGRPVRRRRPDPESRHRAGEQGVLDARLGRPAPALVHRGLPDR